MARKTSSHPSHCRTSATYPLRCRRIQAFTGSHPFLREASVQPPFRGARIEFVLWGVASISNPALGGTSAQGDSPRPEYPVRIPASSRTVPPGMFATVDNRRVTRAHQILGGSWVAGVTVTLFLLSRFALYSAASAFRIRVAESITCPAALGLTTAIPTDALKGCWELCWATNARIRSASANAAACEGDLGPRRRLCHRPIARRRLWRAVPIG